MRSLLASASLFALSCASSPERSEPLAQAIAREHGQPGIYARPALHTDVAVRFGGAPLLEARMTYEASTGRVRLDWADGAVAVFDGEDAWASGLPEQELAMARFHLLTWPYFLAAPWKLADPGARATPASTRTLRGEAKASVRVTFEEGVGDTPDDWYVVYAEPATKELEALAYVVTYGTSDAEAAADPHAATYDEWTRVDGLLLPARLSFWSWSEAGGLGDERIGSATFAEPRFAPAAPDAFVPPTGARRIDVPPRP